MATLPVEETFAGQTDEGAISASNPTSQLDSCSEAYWDGGAFDADAPAGSPSGGLCARGLAHDYLGTPVTLNGFQASNIAATEIDVSFSVYLPSALDPRTDGIGLNVMKILAVGDTHVAPFDNTYNNFRVVWFPSFYRSSEGGAYAGAPALHIYGHGWGAYPNCETDWTFDEWITIRVVWSFGTPGESDGRCAVWINDVAQFDRSDFPFNVKTGADGIVRWVNPLWSMRPDYESYPYGQHWWIDDINIYDTGAEGSPPAISRVSPISGALSGLNEVTITGSNLSTGVTNVMFDGAPATHRAVVSDTEITCRAPAGRADATTVDVRVESANGNATLVDAYTYLDVTSGYSDDFTGATFGANWTEVSNGDGYFDLDESTLFVLKDTDGDGTTPADGNDSSIIYQTAMNNNQKIVVYGNRTGAEDTYQRIRVGLQVSGATWSNLEGFFSQHIHYESLGQLANYEKKNAGGAFVSQVIFWGPPTYREEYSFPAQWRLEMTVTDEETRTTALMDNSQADSNEYWAVKTSGGSPLGYDGTPAILLIGASQWTDSSAFEIDRVIVVDTATVAESPTITDVSPATGATGGGTSVTITGTEFAAGAAVTFGGVSATNITVVSATEITCDTPAGTGSVTVKVTNSDTLYDTLIGGFLYTGAITLTNANPDEGTVDGGTEVTLTGTGFQAGASVSFNDNLCESEDISVDSATTITATTPAGTAGTGDIVVTNPDQGSATLTDGWTYIEDAPVITSVDPDSGTDDGGTSVTITGTGFLSGATVTFGGDSATGVTVVSSTTITCTTPAHAAGDVDVVVTNTDSQSDTLTDGYTYVEATEPTVTSVIPNNGPTTGGTFVSIKGTDFSAGATVKFAGISATAVTVVGPTRITCVTPAAPGGPANVRVTNSDETTGTLTNGFTFIPHGIQPVNFGPKDLTGAISFTGTATMHFRPDRPSRPEDQLADGGTDPGSPQKIEDRFGRTAGRKKT